jgi:hypothetical protein
MSEIPRRQWRQTIARFPSSAGCRSRRWGSTVKAVLRPIRDEKQETASRLRGRLQKILGCVKSKGWRNGFNPAQLDRTGQ